MSLARLNLIAYVLVLLALLCAGGGMFLVLHGKTAADVKQQSESSARLLASNIQGMIAAYRTSGQRLAQHAAEERLLGDAKMAERRAIERLSAATLVNVLKVRLLPAGTHEADSTGVPELSYACLDLLARREKGQAVPDAEFHLMNTPSAHIDVSAPVLSPGDKHMLGHVLLSLDPAVIRAPLAALAPADGFAELRQYTGADEHLVIASGGDAGRKSDEPQVQQDVSGTNWRVAYWAPVSTWKPSVPELAALSILLLLAPVFLVLSLILPQRWLGAALRHDTRTLDTMFNDIRTGVLMGQYPLRLQELKKFSREFLSAGRAMIKDRRNLEQRAQTDSVTGLASRSVFDIRLAQLHGQAKLGLTSALLVADIDHPEELDIQLGADSRETVVKQFAQQLREAVRDSDVVARIDGGQFAVLFALTDLEKITPVVERLRKRLARESSPGTRMPRTLSWSGGLTLLVPSDGNRQAVVARAQAALLEAQREGGNRTVTQQPST